MKCWIQRTLIRRFLSFCGKYLSAVIKNILSTNQQKLKARLETFKAIFYSFSKTVCLRKKRFARIFQEGELFILKKENWNRNLFWKSLNYLFVDIRHVQENNWRAWVANQLARQPLISPKRPFEIMFVLMCFNLFPKIHSLSSRNNWRTRLFNDEPPIWTKIPIKKTQI